ncbi:MAG: glycosyltransferase family 4 protein [Sedimentisphaerales bacterium]|nr:glycosyltransferase family 4 protein [Sedimentisphaerales bacterium]MBN2843096.1 glycosyltransferase family 4 protein [Sedimentisphaerales bacterium]
MLRIARYKGYLANSGMEMDIEELGTKKTARLKQFALSRKYDVVILAGLILTGLELSVLRKLAKKLISDISGTYLLQLMSNDPDNVNFIAQMKVSDLVIACNNYSADQALRYANDVVTLPTAVEVKRYLPMADRAYDSKIRLVWIGNESTLPYLLNIAPVLEEIGTRYDEVVLRIISDKYFKLKKMCVEPVRNKLEYVYNALSDCDIGIAPLREGRFARMLGGVNIRHIFAAGVPIVASPVGESGDMVMHEVNGLLAQNNDQWLNALALLIENLGIGRQYGTAGRELIKANFDTDVISQQLVDVLKEFKK